MSSEDGTTTTVVQLVHQYRNRYVTHVHMGLKLTLHHVSVNTVWYQTLYLHMQHCYCIVSIAPVYMHIH